MGGSTLVDADGADVELDDLAAGAGVVELDALSGGVGVGADEVVGVGAAAMSSSFSSSAASGSSTSCLDLSYTSLVIRASALASLGAPNSLKISSNLSLHSGEWG